MTKAARPRIPDFRTTGPQTSLLAIALVSLLSLALVGVLLFENQVEKSRVVAEAQKDAYHEVMALSGVGVHAIELTDRGLIHFLEHFDHEFADGEWNKERLTNTLFSWLPTLPPRSDLAFYNSTGRMIASTRASQGNDSEALRVLFGEESSGALDVTIAALDQPFGGRVVVGRRVQDHDGHFAGVIAATVDFTALDAAQDLKITQQIDLAFYVAENGTFLASWPKAEPAGSLPMALTSLSRELSGHILDSAGIKIIDKGDWILAISSLRNAPIFAGVGISKERILAQWRTSSWVVYSWVFTIIAAVGLLSTGLLFLHFRRHAATEKLFNTLSRAVEASPAMVFICDARGIVEYVNLKFTEFSGLPFGEVTGIPPYFLDVGSVSKEEVEAIKRSLSAGEEWSGVLEIEDRHGNAGWVSIMISPIRDSRGRITNFVGSMEDVTHRVEDERRLRKIQKMEALECLVGGISHEFNNILLPVVGLSEMALNELSDDSPARKYVERVLVSGRRAARMIEQIRVFSLPDTPAFEKFDVAELIRDLVEKTRALVPEQIALTTGIPACIGAVLVDQKQIEAATTAVVLNAVQAMSDEPGELRIEARLSEPLDSGDTQVVIAFTDSGCGMTEEVVAKAFDPFFTTKEVGQGTGLGLSIARGIIAAHGGAVSIESTPGLGTTVSIILPLLVEAETLPLDEETVLAE